MHERKSVASHMLPAALLLFPIGVAAFAFLTTAVRGDSRHLLIRRFAISLAVFGPLAILSLLSADGKAGEYSLLVLLAAGISSISPKLMSRTGWLIGLCLVLGFQLFQLRQNSMTFSGLGTEYSSLSRLSALLTGSQTLPPSNTSSTPWYRDWRHDSPASAGVAELRLQFRAQSATSPVTWYLYDATQSESADGEVIDFLSPTGNARRTHTSATPLAGRTFLLSGTLSERTVAPHITGACDIVALKVDKQPWINSCGQLVVAPGDSGQFEILWTVPEAAQGNQLRVEFSSEGGRFEQVVVDELGLFELGPNSITRVSGIQPSEIILRLDAFSGEEGESTYSLAGFDPSKDWQQAELTTDINIETTLLRLTLRSPPGTELQVRDVQLDESSGWTALARPSRQAAWFHHPNMAAIVVVGMVLVVVPLNGHLAFNVLAIITAGVAVGISGSRNGFVLFLATITMLAVTKSRFNKGERLERTWVFLVGLMTVAVALVFGLLAVNSRIVTSTFEENSVSRVSIWAAAMEAIGARPLTGWGKSADAALNTNLVGTEPIAHAHNMWLDLGVRYGLPGVLAGIWLTVALVWLGCRRSSYAAVGVAILLLGNFVDTTLNNYYAWMPIFVLVSPLSLVRKSSFDDPLGRTWPQNKRGITTT